MLEVEVRTVAILLSAYNGEKYILPQLDSILQQDCTANLTIFVRDDGSTDGTVETLQNYAALHGNIEIILGGNLGLSGSFRALLQIAFMRGFDYYAFCDQDDYWLPDKLSAALAVLEREDATRPLLYGGCSYLADAKGQRTGGTTQKKKREITFFNTAIQNICPGHSQVLNHTLAQRIVERTESLVGVSSWDLWVANAAAVAEGILFDSTPHTLYRQHGHNQLHYGTGRLAWFTSRLRRLFSSEGRKFSMQLAAFCVAFGDLLNAEQQRETARFFAAQPHFFLRVLYACTTKLYRQKWSETVAFRILYALGAYRPNNSVLSVSEKTTTMKKNDEEI